MALRWRTVGAVGGVLAVVLLALVAIPRHSQSTPAATDARLPSSTSGSTGPTGPTGPQPGARPAARTAARRRSGTPSGPATGHGPEGTPLPRDPAPESVPQPAGWTVTVHRLTSGGYHRYYLVSRPATTSTGTTTDSATTGAGTLPVLVVLHGRDMTPASMIGVSKFLSVVGDAIVVYPGGYDRSWNAGYCCAGAHAAGIDDVAFLQQVVQQVLAQQPGASATHVYLAGFSNGGRMAYRMACDTPGLFAGVAAVEAISVSDCAKTTPVPLLVVAQTGDPLLTIGLDAPPKHIAGHTEITVQAEVDKWRDLNGCDATETTSTLGDLTTHAWDRCAGGARVEEAVYGGGGHTWFAACRDTPSAQSLVWAFFHDTSPTFSTTGPDCPATALAPTTVRPGRSLRPAAGARHRPPAGTGAPAGPISPVTQ